MSVANSVSESHYVSRLSKEQKLKAKETAYKLKFGSPKLRDLLRERCKIRIKESRNISFNKTRLFEHEKNVLHDAIKNELKDLDYDIKLQELIYQETMEEVSQWAYQAIEEELNILSATMESDTTVFCPICEKSEFIVNSDYIICTSCNIKLHSHFTLQKLHQTIIFQIEKHGITCPYKLRFYTEPKSDMNLHSLNSLCDACDFYHSFC